MNTKELVEEIKRQFKYREDTLADATPVTMKARQQRKDMAGARLGDLFFSFRKEFLKKVRPILVVGDNAEVFSNSASKLMGLPHHSGDALFEALVSGMEKELLNGNQSANFILEVAGRILEDAAVDIGLASYPQLIYKSSYNKAIKGPEEAKAFIKKAILEQMGYGVPALFIADKALRAAYSVDGIDQPAYPVLVSFLSEADLTSAMAGFQSASLNPLTVSTGDVSFSANIKSEGLTDSEVISTLKQVRNLMVGLPTKKTETSETQLKPKKTKKEKSNV